MYTKTPLTQPSKSRKPHASLGLRNPLFVEAILHQCGFNTNGKNKMTNHHKQYETHIQRNRMK